MIPQELKDRFEEFAADCKAAGVNMVGVLSCYSPEGGADFSTKYSVEAAPNRGVTEDHVVLDSIREIILVWDDVTHAE